MGFVDAVKRGFTHATNLGGRASRAEWWYFHLFGFIIGFVINLATIGDVSSDPDDLSSGLGIIAGLYLLVMFFLYLSVSIRRLHDIDKSGWWYLLVFVPLVGGLILLWWYAQPGTAGTNKYGNNPLEA
ncbi:MAG: DUF805 domain-containing protein [Rhodobacteraceae bacterium]|nr:DUF805 domain-containing protein [Paracoccaceae bacterium]